MSMNLCGMSGRDALDALIRKVEDPDLILRIGSDAVTYVVGVEHVTDDGLPVVTVRTFDGADVILQFSPSETDFAVTASDQDGRLVCNGSNGTVFAPVE